MQLDSFIIPLIYVRNCLVPAYYLVENKRICGLVLQIWSGRDFKPVKTLAGHESKVAGIDVSTGETLNYFIRARGTYTHDIML